MSSISLGLGIRTHNSALWRAQQGEALVRAAEVIYDPKDIHNDGSGKVDSWVNSGTAGSGWDLAQATSAKRFAYSATGNRAGGPAVVGDGSTSYLITPAVTGNQPSTVIVIATTTDANNARRMCDGRAVNTRALYHNTLFNYLQAGVALGQSGVTNGVWYSFCGVFNGASSINRRNAATVSGDAGTAAASGFCLGTGGTSEIQYWQGTIERAVMWLRALTTAELIAVQTFYGMTG